MMSGEVAFYTLATFTVIYAAVVGRRIMWLYTLAGPYDVSNKAAAIKLRSWEAVWQLAASLLSIPAFTALAGRCLVMLSSESALHEVMSHVSLMAICVVFIYVLAVGYTTPADKFIRLQEKGHIKKDQGGNGEWLSYTIQYFMHHTSGIVLVWLGLVIVSISLIHIALS